MITKSDLINHIRDFIGRGELTKTEVLSLFETETNKKPNQVKLDFSNILSFIGGFIVFMGIVVLVSINWIYLNDVSQVLVTLGSGILAFVIGSLLLYALKVKFTGVSFHLIGGGLIPLGIFVWLSKLADSNINLTAVIFGVFFALMAIYIITDLIIHNDVFIFFSWLFGSIAYWAGFFWVLGNNESLFLDYRLGGVAALVLSSVYLCLSYGLKQVRDNASFFYFLLGTLWFFGSVFTLVFDRPVFEALFVLMILGSFYLSSLWRSRVLLVVNTIYLVIVIFYLSSRYFVEAVGFPVTMIVAGLLLILVSFLVVRLDKQNKLKA
jgi:hypothetical protein